MNQNAESNKLEELILRAIDDLELTKSEYEEIMAQANADGKIDPDEAHLLTELQRLINEGVVKRVPE
jgi:DnaJ-domain-containing protein 1